MGDIRGATSLNAPGVGIYGDGFVMNDYPLSPCIGAVIHDYYPPSTAIETTQGNSYSCTGERLMRQTASVSAPTYLNLRHLDMQLEIRGNFLNK